MNVAIGRRYYFLCRRICCLVLSRAFGGNGAGRFLCVYEIVEEMTSVLLFLLELQL
jgi:hypothetical protein